MKVACSKAKNICYSLELPPLCLSGEPFQEKKLAEQLGIIERGHEPPKKGHFNEFI
jgi:hypothetical protein